EAEAGAFDPFEPRWVLDPAETPEAGQREVYSAESFREWVRDPRKPWQAITADEAQQARGTMEQVLQESQPIAALTAAKKLNSFLNNQSLVILFTFKGKKLLFVGDAQAGNWEHW